MRVEHNSKGWRVETCPISGTIRRGRDALEDAGYVVEEAELPNLKDCALDGYRALLGEFAVKRWLQADAGQAEWNRKVLDYLMHIVQRLDEEGVTLALGSDGGTMYMPPGSSTHRELALMHEAGLAHATVLRTATINAARNSSGRSGDIIRLPMFRAHISSRKDIEKPIWPRNRMSHSSMAPMKVLPMRRAIDSLPDR